MKIFFAFSASALDRYLQKKEDLQSKDFSSSIRTLVDRSLFNTLLCTNKTLTNNELAIIDSETLQKKWAQENNIIQTDSWQVKVLQAQIENASPDVIYTNNPAWISQHYKQLPAVKLRAAWRAAPVKATDDYSCFKLGLSYAPHYLKLLTNQGVQNTELLQFAFDPMLKNRLPVQEQDIDICFVGRYIKLFRTRNQLLTSVYKEFRRNHKIVYHLLTGRRIKGLIPDIPFKLLGAYRKPVFLDDLLDVFRRSKIVINAHSDAADQYKGNMRVYEALGTASFMVSDQGQYPEYLVPGRDFVTYRDEDELIDIIKQYLANSHERTTIAQRGYQTLSDHYSVKIGYDKLQQILNRYMP